MLVFSGGPWGNETLRKQKGPGKAGAFDVTKTPTDQRE
jgi:hypothetical protein